MFSALRAALPRASPWSACRRDGVAGRAEARPARPPPAASTTRAIRPGARGREAGRDRARPTASSARLDHRPRPPRAVPADAPTAASSTRRASDLRAVDPRPLDPRERIELQVGLGELLYLEERFGAAAELFEPVAGRVRDARARRARARARLVGDRARSRRRRRCRRPSAAASIARIIDADGAGAAARSGVGAGQLLAGRRARAPPAISIAPGRRRSAGWIRAALGRDRGVALRADLDRLVTQAIIPERAAPAAGDAIAARRSRRMAAELGSVQEDLVIGRFGDLVNPKFTLESPNAEFQITRSRSSLPSSSRRSRRRPSSGTSSVDRALHLLAHRGGRFVRGLLRRLEQQFVVHGEDHARAAAGDAPAAPRARRSSPLEDVGGGALDRHVDGVALGGRADLAVAAVQTPAPAGGGRTSSSRRRSRARVVERAVDEGAHAREAGEVGVDELLRLLARHADVLRQRERRLPVEQRVVDDLRAAPQLVRARGRCRRRTPSAPCGRGCPRRCVNASISACVAREVRQHAQLDLRVVGRDQHVAGLGDERAADLAAELGADRDVLQVRIAAAQAGRSPRPPG